MYSFDSIVRYSEIDLHGRLRMDAMINYLQDVAVFDINQTDYDTDYLTARRLAWVVNYWQVDILELPRLGDRISSWTSPYDYHNFIGLRNCTIRDEKGKNLVLSHSVWSFIDLQTNRPAKLPISFIEQDPPAPKLDMEYTPRRISYPTEGGEERPAVFITESMLDENRHMNNVQYVRLVMDMAAGRQRKVRRLRIQYLRQAYAGDILQPLVWQKDPLVVCLNGEDKSPYCVIEVLFDE